MRLRLSPVCPSMTSYTALKRQHLPSFTFISHVNHVYNERSLHLYVIVPKLFKFCVLKMSRSTSRWRYPQGLFCHRFIRSLSISVYLNVCLSVCLSFSLSLSLSLSISVYLNVCLCLCLSLFLSV